MNEFNFVQVLTYCARELRILHKRKTIEQVQKEFNNIHGDKYDYDWSTYIDGKTEMTMFCKKHGIFHMSPSLHLYHGCPKCNQSHLEEEIELFLKRNNILYIWQKHFNWLGKFSLDFYLPHYNIGIECQGSQHFKSVAAFGGDEGLKKCQERDEYKRNTCLEHGIQILYYAHTKYTDEIITVKNKLLEEIMKHDTGHQRTDSRLLESGEG